jgi:hypothetical protein
MFPVVAKSSRTTLANLPVELTRSDHCAGFLENLTRAGGYCTTRTVTTVNQKGVD